MNVRHNLHQFVPQQPEAASRPYAIESGGVTLGTAVTHELGVRFIAADVRVKDMDQSIWPSVRYARESAQQLFRSARNP
jgi:hypothetical protein